MAIAVGRIFAFGASPVAWDIAAIGVPLVLGWIAQVMIGSWTHLVPAIGPGDPKRHAVWRQRLGWMATPRLIAWNAGVAALAFGLPAGSAAALAIGAALTGASLLVALALLVSVLPGRRGALGSVAPIGA